VLGGNNCSVSDKAADAPAFSGSGSVHDLSFLVGEIDEEFFP
jgi:hypothetical protein